MIEAFKEYVLALPDNKAPAHDLRMSVAGECPRKLEYQALEGSAPIGFDSFMRMESGVWLGRMMAHWFDRAFPGNFVNQEMEVKLLTPKGREIVGHIDGEVKSVDAVLDFKWVSSNSFQMITDQGKPLDANIDQIALYTEALKKSASILIYINRESPGLIAPFMFGHDSTHAANILARLDSVIDNREAKKISDRPYHDKSESPCWYCPYKDKCYEGFSGEIQAYKIEELVHDEAFKLAKQAVLSRTLRLIYEKTEEDMRSGLGSLLNGMQIKQATLVNGTEKLSASLTVGKKDNLITTVREIK